MLSRTLGASLLGNVLKGKGTIRAGEETIRAGKSFLMPPHSLPNFEIQKYYENEPNFNEVFFKK